MKMEKTKRKATIYDGHSHIERRVFLNEDGEYCVRINGFFTTVEFLRRVNRFEVEVWWEG